MAERIKLTNLKELMDALSSKIKVIYDNGIQDGEVVRVEFNPNKKSHTIVVKHFGEGYGLNNYSNFTFYKNKTNEVYLNAFYYYK